MKVIYITKIDGFINNGVLERFGISPVNLRRRIAGVAYKKSVSRISEPRQVPELDLLLCDTSCDPESIINLLKAPCDLAIVIHKGQIQFNNFFGRISRKWPEQEIIFRGEHSDDGPSFELLHDLADAPDQKQYDSIFNHYIGVFRKNALIDFRHHIMDSQMIKNCYLNHLAPGAPYPWPYLLRSLMQECPRLEETIRDFFNAANGSPEKTHFLQDILRQLEPASALQQASDNEE